MPGTTAVLAACSIAALSASVVEQPSSATTTHCLIAASPAGYQDPEHGAQQGELRGELLKLALEELGTAEFYARRAGDFAADGKVAAARDELARTKKCLRDANHVLRWLGSERPPWYADEYLSLIKVRVVRSRPNWERQTEHGDPSIQRLGKFMGLFDSVQAIDAEILEVHAVGKAYRRGTLKARWFPSWNRTDLRVGREIQLKNDTKSSISHADVGQVYWLLIGPEDLDEPLPSLIGGGDHSKVRLAVQAEEPAPR